MRRLLVAALLVWGTSNAAAAPIPTCVVVEAPHQDALGLKSLVQSELDRHPTHYSADADCQSHLRIELFEIAGGIFLTGRINEEVPHREKVADKSADALTKALGDLLTVVLHNDPIRLSGPRRLDWLNRSVADLRQRGETYYGAEAFQAMAVLDGNITSVPGLAAVVRREVGSYHVGMRLAGAYHPEAEGASHLQLLGIYQAQAELTWFTDPLAETSFFVAATLGLEMQHFIGPSADEGEVGTARDLGLTAGARIGWEMFRAADTRANVFLQGVLPAFVAKDVDHGVVDHWVPTVALGVGLLL